MTEEGEGEIWRASSGSAVRAFGGKGERAASGGERAGALSLVMSDQYLPRGIGGVSNCHRTPQTRKTVCVCLSSSSSSRNLPLFSPRAESLPSKEEGNDWRRRVVFLLRAWPPILAISRSLAARVPQRELTRASGR